MLVFTIGSSDRTAENFAALIQQHGITQVFDLRTSNGSRNLAFDEKRYKRLSALCQELGITYNDAFHISLGGSQLDQRDPASGERKMTVPNFRRFARTAEFRTALQALQEAIRSQSGASVLLCCERDVKQCHRGVIAAALEEVGWSPVHLT